MRHEVSGRAGAPDGPGNLARGHRQGVEQHWRAVADILMLTALAPARLRGLGRGFALQDLHAGFFIAAEHQPALLVGRQSLGVQLANGLRFGIKVLIMAVEPIFALVRFEVDVVQDTPDAGAADRVGLQGLEQGRHYLIQGPPCDGTIVVVGAKCWPPRSPAPAWVGQ